MLPITIPKDRFLHDLDFYGIVSEEGTVRTRTKGWLDRMKSQHDAAVKFG